MCECEYLLVLRQFFLFVHFMILSHLKMSSLSANNSPSTSPRTSTTVASQDSTASSTSNISLAKQRASASSATKYRTIRRRKGTQSYLK